MKTCLGRYKKEIILVSVVLLGAAVRLFFLINRNQFWVDEIISCNISENNIFNLFSRLSKPVEMETTITDNFPPLYYILFHFWMYLGSSEIFLRSFSFLFGILSILMTWKITKRFFGEKIALCSVFLMSISAFNIHYSVECRPYTLFLFLSLSSFYYFLKILEKGEGKFLYAISTIACIYTFYYGLFMLAVENIIFFGYMLKKKNVFLGKWILLQSLILFSFLPWIKIFYHHFFWTYPEPGPLPFSILTRGASVLEKNFAEFNMDMGIGKFPCSGVIYNYILLIFGCLLLVGFFALKDKKNKLFILSAYFVAPLMAQICISEKEVVTRAFIFLTPVYYIILSHGIIFLKEKKNIFTSFFVLLILFSAAAVNGISLRNFYESQCGPEVRADWKNLVNFVRSENKHENNLILVDRGKIVPILNYYYKNKNDFIGFLSPKSKETALEYRNYTDKCLGALGRKYGYFWVIHSPFHKDRSNFTERLISKYLTVVNSKNFGEINVKLCRSKIIGLDAGFYQFGDLPVWIAPGEAYVKEKYIQEGFYSIYIIAGHSDTGPFYGNMALLVDGRTASRKTVGASFNYIYEVKTFIGEGSHNIEVLFEKDPYGIKNGRKLYIKDIFFVKNNSVADILSKGME